MILPSGFVKLIEKELLKAFDVLVRSAEVSSAMAHRRMLSKFQEKWTNIRSYDTCLICLRRRPQYGLPCGHCICDNCVQVFGTLSCENPWDFQLQCCLLCGLATPGLVVKVKPKTATVRLLSVDGGGIRGSVSLEFIQALQDRVGLPMPIQDHFDVAYGTSSGE